MSTHIKIPFPMADRRISVISPQYCVSNPINLRIETEKGVTHINDKAVFHVEKPPVSLHGRRFLYDASGDPIVTLYEKNWTAHGRCQVFRGNSTDSNKLLFSVKRPSMIPGKKNIDLDVFLVSNTKERVCDFKVKGCSKKKSCEIYAGECSTILAKMENNGAFKVTVQPNVDHAFIVALLMIVDDIGYFKIVKAAVKVSKLAISAATAIGTVLDCVADLES